MADRIVTINPDYVFPKPLEERLAGNVKTAADGAYSKAKLYADAEVIKDRTRLGTLEDTTIPKVLRDAKLYADAEAVKQTGKINSLITSGPYRYARNVILNPGPHGATPAWITSWGAAGAGTRVLVEDVKAPSQVAYLRHTWTTSATSTAALVRTSASPITAGTMYSGSIWVRSSIPNIMGATFSFYAETGTQIGTNVFNRLYRVPANQWTRLDINGYTAPEGAAFIRIGAAVNGAGAAYAKDDMLDVSAAVTTPEGRVFDYFDGDSPGAYWQAAPVESSSVTSIQVPDFGTPFTKAPTHAGGRKGRYSRDKRMYLPEGADIGPLRRRIQQALDGQNTLRLAWLGHSIVAGQGGSPGVMDNVRLLQQRAAQSGSAVTGLVTAANNTTTDTRLAFDPEWEMLGGPRSNMQLHRRCMVAGKAFTYTSTTPGSVVDIYTFGNGSPVTYSIDGASPVTITPTGLSAIQVTTVEGLANRTHKVAITSTTGTAAYLLGISVRRLAGLEISNFGYSGSVAGDWRTDYFSASGRFYNGYNDVFTSWAADAAIIQLGANELIHDSTPEKLEADLSNIVAAARTAGKDVVLILDTPVEDSTRKTWVSDFCPAVYNVADAYRVPLVDFTAHWISRPVAAAQDFYADQWHPSAKGYYDLHEVMADVLLP